MLSYSPGQEAARRLLEGPQRYTCLAGGTRSGKTFLIVRAIVARALEAPGSRHAILRFHANAARASISLDTLPNVMRLCFPRTKLKEHRQEGFFELTNTSRIWIGGLDDKERVEKILGLEYASIFLNEASQIPYASALIAFTRLAQKIDGLKQRAYVDLNPVAKSHWTNLLFGDKRDPVSKKKLADAKNYVRGHLNPTDNSANLAPEFLESLANLPERQRKRFYEGVYVDELEAALWSYEIIEATRSAPEIIPEDQRASVVVAVDPSGAAGRDDLNADEIGVIVAARGADGDCYILADRSCRDAPAVWGRRAVTAFHEFRADCIVAESNFGGEMVRATIHAADPNVPVRLVTASRGKAVRAEPISVRYAQRQVHHAGHFTQLEDQLCAFTAAGFGGTGSPDRADAAIWALTYLFDLSDGTGIIEFYGVAKTFIQTKEPDLKGPFDEWLARIVCFAFSISPQALTQQMNRATAQTQKEMSEEEGLAPILAWVKDLIDQIIAQEFDAPDLEFAWSAEPSINPQAQEAILSSYMSKGIITINEARAALGRDPYPDATANRPMTLTGQGYVPLGQAGKALLQNSIRITTNAGVLRRRMARPVPAGQRQTRRPLNWTATMLGRIRDLRLKGSQTQQALITCDELWDSDWAICNSSTFAEDRYNYKQCMIGLLQRNKECLAGLPLSPLLPY